MITDQLEQRVPGDDIWLENARKIQERHHLAMPEETITAEGTELEFTKAVEDERRKNSFGKRDKIEEKWLVEEQIWHVQKNLK
ncbi:hypothetical protein TNCV_1235471 [Trichonephila clavipes]|nr:hypothetical protein TNCV_1235471 [Trichonephila clavipes]